MRCPAQRTTVSTKEGSSLHLVCSFLITDFEEEYPSAKDVAGLQFPVAQAEIRGCSTYTVVCRLKSSPTYTITSNGGYFNLPEYPNVCVTIPKKAVASKAKISLQIKVSLLLRRSSHVICFQYTRNSARENSFGQHVLNIGIPTMRQPLYNVLALFDHKKSLSGFCVAVS